MRTLSLPEVLDTEAVLAAFGPSDGHLPWTPDEDVEIAARGAPPTHVEPLGLVALAAWAARARRAGRRIIVSDSLKSRYTWNTGLLSSLDHDPPWCDAVEARNDLFPLCHVALEERVESLGAGVARSMHIQEAQAARDIVYTISEIVRNAHEHSGSDIPTSFAAGYFRSQRRFTYAVADTGRGIAATLRRKGLLTPEDDDASAIDKAIQPHVTGAGKRGEPGAPNNAGMGLAMTRVHARNCGGEMLVWSGTGLFRERRRDGGQLLRVSRWPGTLVSVTLFPQRIGAAIGNPGDLGLGTAHRILFDGGPADAVELRPPVDTAGFAGNKSWYIANREAMIAALRAGAHVRIQFSNAVYSTQSAIHALLYVPITELGPQILDRIHFSSSREQLRAVIRLVVAYSIETYNLNPAASDPSRPAGPDRAG